jgi:hypothetical protein
MKYVFPVLTDWIAVLPGRNPPEYIVGEGGLTWWNFDFRLFPGTIRSPQIIEFLSHLASGSIKRVQMSLYYSIINSC